MCLANENRRNRQQNVRKRCKKNTKTTVFFQYELVKNQNSTKSVTKKKTEFLLCLARSPRFAGVSLTFQRCIRTHTTSTLRFCSWFYFENDRKRVCRTEKFAKKSVQHAPYMLLNWLNWNWNEWRAARSPLAITANNSTTAQPHGFVLDAKCWRNWRITECTWRGAALVRAQEGGVNARCTVVVTVT